MDRKTYTQISLIILVLFIISYVYFAYFKVTKEIPLKTVDDDSTKIMVKGSDDLISDMSYFSEDNKGNRYEIFSEYGTINPDKSNLIFMEKSLQWFIYQMVRMFISTRIKQNIMTKKMIQVLVVR